MLMLMGDTSSRVAARGTWNTQAGYPPLADVPLRIPLQDEGLSPLPPLPSSRFQPSPSPRFTPSPSLGSPPSPSPRFSYSRTATIGFTDPSSSFSCSPPTPLSSSASPSPHPRFSYAQTASIGLTDPNSFSCSPPTPLSSSASSSPQAASYYQAVVPSFMPPLMSPSPPSPHFEAPQKSLLSQAASSSPRVATYSEAASPSPRLATYSQAAVAGFTSPLMSRSPPSPQSPPYWPQLTRSPDPLQAPFSKLSDTRPLITGQRDKNEIRATGSLGGPEGVGGSAWVKSLPQQQDFTKSTGRGLLGLQSTVSQQVLQLLQEQQQRQQQQQQQPQEQQQQLQEQQQQQLQQLQQQQWSQQQQLVAAAPLLQLQEQLRQQLHLQSSELQQQELQQQQQQQRGLLQQQIRYPSPLVQEQQQQQQLRYPSPLVQEQQQQQQQQQQLRYSSPCVQEQQQQQLQHQDLQQQQQQQQQQHQQWSQQQDYQEQQQRLQLAQWQIAQAELQTQLQALEQLVASGQTSAAASAQAAALVQAARLESQLKAAQIEYQLQNCAGSGQIDNSFAVASAQAQASPVRLRESLLKAQQDRFGNFENPSPPNLPLPNLRPSSGPNARPWFAHPQARTELEGPIYGPPGGSAGRDTWQQCSAPGGSTSASPSAAAAAIAAARAASARKSRGYGQAGRSPGLAYNGSSRGSPKKGGRGGKGFPYNSTASSSGPVVSYPPFSPRAVLDSSRAIARNESALSDASSEGSSGVDAQGAHLLELTCGWQDLSHIPNVQVTGGVSRPAVCSVKERDDEEALPSQEELDTAMC